MSLAYSRTGSGPPLVLLHGIGMSRQSWTPVIDGLAERCDVISVDLPGFGGSAPLADSTEPSPAALARAVAELLDDLAVVSPHVAGNSIGGWVALELAGIRSTASLALLSPAGLWREGTPLYNRLSLRTTRWLALHGVRPLSRLVNNRFGRVLVLRQVVGRPSRMSPELARTMVSDMATSPGYDAAFAATLHRHYSAPPRMDVPITVAFGSRDLLLRRASRRIDQLPPGACRVPLPGCGHVPMNDDPSAVIALITAAVQQAGALAPGIESAAVNRGIGRQDRTPGGVQ